MAQLRADIDNKWADTGYKQALSRSEPYKAMTAVLAAFGAVVATIFGALGYILGRGH